MAIFNSTRRGATISALYPSRVNRDRRTARSQAVGLPWKAYDMPHGVTYICSPTGYFQGKPLGDIAILFESPRRARDGERIVRSVNAFDSLLTAVRDALAAVDVAQQQCHPTLSATLETLTERARQTLAGVAT